MKQNLLALAILCLLSIGSNKLYSQNELIVKMQDGTEESHAVSFLRKITFSDNQVNLTTFDENTSTFAMSSINYMYILSKSITGNKEQFIYKNDNPIYPNPATDIIYLNKVIDKNAHIVVYDLNGQLVMQKQVLSPNDPVDISRLLQGTYLLVADGKTFKFAKR